MYHIRLRGAAARRRPLDPEQGRRTRWAPMTTPPLRRGAPRRAAAWWHPLLPILTAPLLGGAMPPPGALVNVPPAHHAYAPGEALAYEISWSGVPAGRAVMSVVGGTDKDGRPVHRLISVANTNKVVTVVYKVRDRIMSEIDPVTGIPRHILVDQRHGSRIRIQEVFFDQAHRRATTYQPKRKPVTVDTPPNVHDIISCLYYVRSMDGLEPGKTVVVDVHEGKKNWRLLIHGERREHITVPAGSFDTLEVKAEVRFQGVFFDRGDVRLWLTEDARRIPVLVSIKIQVGRVLAELTHMTLPPLGAPLRQGTPEAGPSVEPASPETLDVGP